MRDYIYIFLIALLSFCSCTPELSEQNGKGDNCVELTLHNMDMSTKAEDDPGTESERKISRLDIFFYTTGSSGNCLFHAQRTGLNSTSGTTSVSVYIFIHFSLHTKRVDDLTLSEALPFGRHVQLQVNTVVQLLQNTMSLRLLTERVY